MFDLVHICQIKNLNGVFHLFQTSHIKLWQETRIFVIFVGSNAFYLCGACFIREDKFETVSVSVAASFQKAAYADSYREGTGRHIRTWSSIAG